MAKDKLTVRQVEAAKPRRKRYKLFDGGGLYLLVGTDGSRYWRFKYRLDGKEKLLSLGVYSAVPLKAARARRDRARELIYGDEKRDPSEARKREKAARRAATENTFEAVAREWYAKKSPAWATSNARVILRRLERDVFADIGDDPVSKLSGPRLLEVLRKVENRGAVESAHRIRQYVSAVMRYAAQTHRIAADPTPHPEVLAARTPERFASITDPKQVGALMRAIRGYSGNHLTRMALQLAPLVFTRPGELRAAEWAEINLDDAEWTIAAERTKMRRPHLVPLSTQAVALLADLQKHTGHGRFVFPGERSRARPMSENTVLAALRAMGYSNKQMTPHGFRHMASTQLHESRKWRSEVIERQLAHADRNTIRGTYNMAEYLPERREMMQWWADRLDSLASAVNVVGIRKGA
jgi:integrase